MVSFSRVTISEVVLNLCGGAVKTYFHHQTLAQSKTEKPKKERQKKDEKFRKTMKKGESGDDIEPTRVR